MTAKAGYVSTESRYVHIDKPTSSPHLRNRWREKRLARFMAIVDKVLAEKSQCRILDIGGTVAFWNALSDQWAGRNIHVTMINLEGEPTGQANFESYAGDARALDYADNSFDLVHSNSVIEHVGRWGDMKRMAGEVRRLAPRYFVQTPNYGFPIEPHFRAPAIHWLPPQTRVWMIQKFGIGFYPRAKSLDEAMRYVEDAILLTAQQMAELFPEARIEREKFALMTKSLVAVRD